jgi:prepilin-type N-terminal cleavage/methylation domain-containing protein
MRYFFSRLGFSLIEVIVVISITLFFMSMTIAYNRTSGSQTILFSEQAKVAGVLNRARSIVLSRRSLDGAVCGVGVLFDNSVSPNALALFSDVSCDGLTNDDDVLDTIVVNPSVKILSPVAMGNNYVLFKTPYSDPALAGGLSFPLIIELQSIDRPGKVFVEVSLGGGVTML